MRDKIKKKGLDHQGWLVSAMFADGDWFLCIIFFSKAFLVKELMFGNRSGTTLPLLLKTELGNK